MNFIRLMMIFVAVTFVQNVSVFAHDAEEKPHYHDIVTEQVKALIDSGKTVTLVDARNAHMDNKLHIPNSLVLPYDSSDKTILEKLPSKDAVIVVYCGSSRCPAAKYLADKLLELGYTNVYKYPAGLQGWMDKGYPIERGK